MLQGRVYQRTWDGGNSIVTPFNGSLTDISAGFWDGGNQTTHSGGGSITSGQLNFSIGVPATMPISVGQFFGTDEGFDMDFDSLTFSNANVGIAPIERLVTSNGNPIFMGVDTPTRDEFVRFVYAASDVTVSGAGRTWVEDDGFTIASTSFTLNLQQGWNAFRIVSTGNANGTAGRISILPGTPANAVWEMRN